MASPRSTLRVDVLSWRDRSHPEGGGAEHYLERIARGLVEQGCEVRIHCAAVPGAARRENRDGYTLIRAGGRYGVYPRALAGLLGTRHQGGRPDVVIDVQNGVPFFSRLITRALGAVPVVVLCHHVHREQWPIVLGPRWGRLGWWIESRVAPRVYRGCQYLTVSQVSRDELIELGVNPEHIRIVHNGVDPLPQDVAPAANESPPATGPRLIVLGRLVPHKRVEHAMDVVKELSQEFPGLHLDVIGEGWWHDELNTYAADLGVGDQVTFHGFVDEATKHALLAQASVMLVPSVKEGWGLVVIEAAQHAVPTIAYADAGGVAESIIDGATGVLVDDLHQLVQQTRVLLTEDELRRALGAAARTAAHRYTWSASVRAVLDTLQAVADGRPPSAGDDASTQLKPDSRQHPDLAEQLPSRDWGVEQVA